ncbi:MAG: cation-transporting P-type ATPase [Ruminococcaceae bacterium]|nr:cation-transporting P-type ATPase [Oscillospiraceae bacterium]
MTGLTDAQVAEQREKFGSNKLPEPKQKKWYHFAAEALSEKITLVLIVIAVVQLVLAILGVMEISEPVMIGLVLGIVTAIAVRTGLGVQKSATELRKKSSLRYCDVLRNGHIVTINKDELVVGDIVLIETGKEIFADGYIIDGKVKVNNAAINGETKECRKTPVEGYVHVKTTSTDAYTNQNCLFAGTSVMSGAGRMIVTDVGINTVNGDTLVKTQTLEAPKTALDIALDKLSDFISRWGTLAAVITFIILTVTGIMETGFSAYFTGNILGTIQKIAGNISVALTIIVAAVPEGLPLIVKLVTKQNVKTMERFNILAKNPGKIPELAYVNLICTDKTGTLTTGVMSPELLLSYTGEVLPKETLLFAEIKKNIVLNNSAVFDSEGVITGGNSVDRAVLSLVTPQEAQSIKAQNKKADRQVFSSSNKYSAFSATNGISYYKGAPEKLISRCTHVMTPEGEIADFDTKEQLLAAIKNANKRSIRCIALTTAQGMLTENELPDNMTFLGIIGVVDPLRPEVKGAVDIAHKAGTQVIEITGDSIDTAIAVATECGIYKDGDVAIANDDFEKLSDEEIKKLIPDLRVISRCSPQTKLRLVTLAQEIGMSVAMTGDGVNDSPALKRADVGFGMQTGSDVAKEASDIILTDDNFASVVKAVHLGRTFMHNIMMFLLFQLPINICLLILSMVYPVFGAGAILASVQILIINIIMDSLNSLSFGSEPPKPEYMREKPLEKGSGLFMGGVKSRIALSTIAFIIAYCIMLFTPLNALFPSAEESLTARFALMCFMAVLNGFNIRTDSINLFKGLMKNKLFSQIAVGIFIGVILLCTFVGGAVKLCPLSFVQWVTVIGLSFIVIPFDIIRKAIANARNKKTE